MVEEQAANVELSSQAQQTHPSSCAETKRPHLPLRILATQEAGHKRRSCGGSAAADDAAAATRNWLQHWG